MTVFITYEELRKKQIEKIKKAKRVLIGHGKNSEVEQLLKEEIKGEEIVLYHPFLEEEPQQLPFEMLLLDERYAEGYINVPTSVLTERGFLNERLRAKFEYEFLLRLAEKSSVVGIRYPNATCLKNVNGQVAEDSELKRTNGKNTGECTGEYITAFDEYQTDCYIAGKYSTVLQKLGCFNEVVTDLIQRAAASGNEAVWVKWMEEMLGHGEGYWYLEDGTAPILVYYGVTYCYNILNTMLSQLVAALEKNGERVITYDEQVEDIVGLSRFVGQRFKAIIGVQTYLMSVYLKESGQYLHDKIIGPKFNIILDHPIWLKEQLENIPNEYYVLTHDANYKKFVEQYYPKVRAAYLFPPGGTEQKINTGERKYGISFIGTYGDYRKKCEVIRRCVPQIKFQANRFLLYMRKMPELTAEQAFQKMLAYYGIALNEQEFLQQFFEMRSVIQCVMYYYREKVIETLLEAGIKVDIWGSSWNEYRLKEHPCLNIHEDISPEESLLILRQSAVSLNIMAWHKGGFTERMANSMLSGAVLLTDETGYQKFEKEADNYCVMFSLKKLDELPGIARKLLEDAQWRKETAERGYAYAKKYHTWDCRAKEFLTVLKQLEAGDSEIMT